MSRAVSWARPSRMHRPRAELQDRFRAALLGLAIGDALGFPVRGVPPAGLRRLPDLADAFAPRPRGRYPQGQWSDDTALAVVAAESIAEAGSVDGRRFAARLAAAMDEGQVVQPSRAVAASVERLARGLPWMSAGEGLGVRDASAVSRGAAVGLFEAGPRRGGRGGGGPGGGAHTGPPGA